MNYLSLNSAGGVVASGSSGGGSANAKAVIFAGGNSVSNFAANGTQDTYIYSTQVGSSNTINTGGVWMADAPGSIVGVSMTQTGNNQSNNNNVQFMKNGSALGPLQVLGPVTSQNTAGASFAAGAMPFVKGDTIRVITGNDTAATVFSCEVWFTVAFS